MRSDENVKQHNTPGGEALGNFGDTSPRNSFSGGETDHLFLSHRGEQFYDLDALSGLADPGDGRSLAALDYDRDGWVDFVVASANAPTFQLHRNRIGEIYNPKLEGAGMIALRFRGGNRSAQPSNQFSPRNGYGCMVTVELDDGALLREFRCGEGRASQNSATMIVGVGQHAYVERVSLRWPSGREQELEGVPVGSLLTVFENSQDSPTGEAFVVESYLRRVSTPGARQTARARLSFTLPRSDRVPKLNVITAMSTHCPSCKRMQPQVAALRAAFDADEVGFFGVGTDLDETAGDLAAYVAAHGPRYDVLTDLPLAERRALREYVREQFKDDLTPVTIVTDPTGEVLYSRSGIPSVSDLRRLLHGSDGAR